MGKLLKHGSLFLLLLVLSVVFIAALPQVTSYGYGAGVILTIFIFVFAVLLHDALARRKERKKKELVDKTMQNVKDFVKSASDRLIFEYVPKELDKVIPEECAEKIPSYPVPVNKNTTKKKISIHDQHIRNPLPTVLEKEKKEVNKSNTKKKQYRTIKTIPGPKTAEDTKWEKLIKELEEKENIERKKVKSVKKGKKTVKKKG